MLPWRPCALAAGAEEDDHGEMDEGPAGAHGGGVRVGGVLTRTGRLPERMPGGTDLRRRRRVPRDEHVHLRRAQLRR